MFDNVSDTAHSYRQKLIGAAARLIRAVDIEIDFTKPLTDEQKAYLKEHLPDVEKAAGGVFFDPTVPLTRTDAEQLKIRYKAAGKEIEETIQEALERASKGEGADQRFRQAAEAIKFQEAHTRFVEATTAGQMPTDEDLTLVAAGIGVTKEQLAAGLGGGTADDGDTDKGKAKAPAKGTAPLSGEDFEAAVEAAVNKRLGKRLLPTEYHGQYLSEGFQKHTDALLKGEIEKALKADPVLAKLGKEAGDDDSKKAILGQMTRMLTSTVEQQARGRAIQIAQAGSGDILEELPGIVKDLVAQADPAAILAKVAPQPIVFGASAPGEVPITVLSKEKVPHVSMDDPNYEDNLVKEIGQQIAQKMALTST